jgi:hypothetical protein
MDLMPDVDYSSMLSDLPPEDHTAPEALGEWLSWAWAGAYRSQVATSELLTFDHAATFLFDQAQAGAPQEDRSIAAWGFSRPGRRPRDVAYQRRYPSPQGRAERQLDKGHMVPHSAGGEFGPNIFPQDRDLNRGWSPEGRCYRALEKEIVKAQGTFFFCCLRSRTRYRGARRGHLRGQRQHHPGHRTDGLPRYRGA